MIRLSHFMWENVIYFLFYRLCSVNRMPYVLEEILNFRLLNRVGNVRKGRGTFEIGTITFYIMRWRCDWS